MGWGKLTKPKKATKTYKEANKTSFGTRGVNERGRNASNSTGFSEESQEITGYDYKPIEKELTLREKKQREKAYNVFNNPNLSEEQKKFQLQQLINEEKIHKNKFKPDKEKKQHLRDRMLNKTDDKDVKQKTVNGVSFSQRTDGNLWSDD